MAPHFSTLTWRIPWTEEPGRLQSVGSLGVGHFHFSLACTGEEIATHPSVLAWRIPGTGEPGGLPSMGSHRVGHDWSDLALTVTPRVSQVALVVKNAPANAADKRGFNPWVGRMPWRRHGNPLQYSCLGTPMDRGAWRATNHVVAKSRTWLKWPSTHAVTQNKNLRTVMSLHISIRYMLWHQVLYIPSPKIGQCPHIQN